uniref:5'-3' exonuclease H3TH domain-containing protein n=1 Tax=Gryllotalpicola sp. TaxID=1932787 RepID=UPI00262D1CA7
MPDAQKPTLLLIDGHSLAFRAFYALPLDSFSTVIDGKVQHTNAIHGFLAMLLNLIKNERPTHIGVAFDISRYSFRTREYPEYKGTRGETPEEFKGQVPLLEEALDAMGIPWLVKEDFEADDILATLSHQGAEQGFDVRLVSGDRDTIQLIRPGVTLLYPNTQGVTELKRYDREAVIEKYGVEPSQYPEMAALVGETSDNLPGIPKVGQKTAAKWIHEWGTVDQILAHADDVTGVVGENLRTYRENALRNRRLNELVRTVELPLGPADLVMRPLDPDAVTAVFGRLQFRSLLDRVLRSGLNAGVAAPGDDSAVAAAPGSALPPVRTLLDEELAHWLAGAAGKPVGVQFEHGPAGLSGFGLSTLDDSVFVPFQAGTGDYVAFAAWLASDAPKRFFDAKTQLKLAASAGLPIAGVADDTRVAGALLTPYAIPVSLAD